MSSEDGSRTGAPDVEKTLVAALGFEPTAGLPDDAADLLVDDGTGNALDWSESESDSDQAESDVEVQERSIAADGTDAANSSSQSTAKASDSTMTPPKGKGKGPRTYKNSSKSGSPKKKPGSTKSDPKVETNGESANSVDATAKLAKDAATKASSDTITDVDPADLIDADSSGVKPVAVNATDDLTTTENGSSNEKSSAKKPSGKKPSAKKPSGKGLSGGDVVEATPADIDLDVDLDETGPMATAARVEDTGPLPATSSHDDPPPPAVEDVILVDPNPIDPVADAVSVPAAETVIVESPPTAPVEEVAPSTPAAPAAPVVDPPPPAVGDPVPEAVATNGAAAAAAGGAVVGRVSTGSSDLAARVPQLLDQGFLKRTKRVRARKVRRVVRHIDPWSILTFSVLFFMCLFAALLLASVLVWNAAVAAGTIENIESFIREIGDYQTYEIKGDVVFRAAMVIAGILTLATSVMVILLVVVFNLISDLVGGIRVTVVEEETVRVRRRQ